MIGKNALLKVIILGDGAVGKSCLMQRYVNNKFDINSYHTIGVEFLNKEIIVDDKTYILQIWDTAGQERFKTLRTPFYRDSDLCLLVFSVDDKESLKNLSKWKEEFLYYSDIKNPSSFPFVVLGNKIDISEDEREVKPEEGLAWCKSNGNLPFFEISAKDSTNVGEAFTTAVKTWAAMEEKQEKSYDSDLINLCKLDQKPSKSSICC